MKRIGERVSVGVIEGDDVVAAGTIDCKSVYVVDQDGGGMGAEGPIDMLAIRIANGR